MSTATFEQLLTSLVPLDAATTRIVSLDVTLPVEISLRDGDVLIDAPRWRWRTDFDVDPSRLRLQMREVVS
jgi:hypothetical protein